MILFFVYIFKLNQISMMECFVHFLTTSPIFNLAVHEKNNFVHSTNLKSGLHADGVRPSYSSWFVRSNQQPCLVCLSALNGSFTSSWTRRKEDATGSRPVAMREQSTTQECRSSRSARPAPPRPVRENRCGNRSHTKTNRIHPTRQHVQGSGAADTSR